MRLIKMRRDVLPDRIAAYIIESIQRGELRVGDRVPSEQHLSAGLGVSRSTVREALQRLTSMGVITRRGKAAYIDENALTALSTQELFRAVRTASFRQLYEARRVLEVTAVELACRRAKPHHIQRLEQAIARMEARLDVDAKEFLAIDLEFHVELVRATENPVLVNMFNSIRLALMREFSELANLPHVRRASLENHYKLLEAVRRGDVVTGRRLMNEVFDSIEQAFHSHINDE